MDLTLSNYKSLEYSLKSWNWLYTCIINVYSTLMKQKRITFKPRANSLLLWNLGRLKDK